MRRRRLPRDQRTLRKPIAQERDWQIGDPLSDKDLDYAVTTTYTVFNDPEFPGPFRFVGFSNLAENRNLAGPYGLRPEDFPPATHPIEIWLIFRSKVRSGRYALWIEASNESLIIYDSQVADKCFSNFNRAAELVKQAERRLAKDAPS